MLRNSGILACVVLCLCKLKIFLHVFVLEQIKSYTRTLMKSLTTKSFKASQFTGRNQLLQKTRPLTSLTFSSRALSFGLLRFSNDRPRKVQATKPDLVRLSPPLFSNQRKKPKEGSDHNKANESPLQNESDSISIEKALL